MNYKLGLSSRIADNSKNPLSLKGDSLDAEFAPNSLQKEGSPGWNKPVHSVHYPPEEALAFPDELWLNTGERSLAFDLRMAQHGLIFSDRASEIMGDALTKYFKIARLHIVNRKGHDISSDKMYYAKPLQPQFVWNPDKTAMFDREVMSGYFPILQRQIESFVLRDDIVDPIIYTVGLDQCLLIASDLAGAAQEAGLVGLDFVTEQEFADRYNARLEFINSDGSPAI